MSVTSPRIAAVAAALALVAAPMTAQAQLPGQVVPASEIKAGSYSLDKAHAAITFVVNHLGFSDFFGRFDSFDATLTYDPANPEATGLEVMVDPASVNTNVPALDDHMRNEDFFHVEEYPEVTFTATEVSLIDDRSGTITGDLTILGETRPVQLEVTFNGAGVHPFNKKYVMGFNATTTIKRSDFGMDGYVPAIGDEVTLMIAAEFIHDGEGDSDAADETDAAE